MASSVAAILHEADMTEIPVPGSALDAVQVGEGPPLLLVHGSASDRRTWVHQLDTFADRYRVTAYSRRYHWPNEPIPEDADYLFDEHVSDLEVVLRRLREADGSEPAHLVGHSYGGFLGLVAAMRSPALVASMVLVEPPVVTLFVSDPPRPLELLRLFLTRPGTALALLKFGMAGLGPATAAARKGDMEEATRIFGRAVMGEAYRDISDERLEQVRANTFRAEFVGSGFPEVEPDEVRGVDVPTLLVKGAQSPGLFHRVVARLGELLPDARTLEIEAASHLVHETGPDIFNRRVLAFVGTV